MAATDWSRVLAAAALLPGVAAAQGEPEPASVAFKWLSYRDRQPGFARVAVDAPAMALRLPLGARWGLEGSATIDDVSGATPRWHSSVSGASRMVERREAGDLKVTRYGERHRLSIGVAASDENDFRSRAVSLAGRWSSDDQNLQLDAGIGYTRDRIGSVDDPSLDERRRTVEATAALTAALNRTDLVQLGLTHADGSGFYSDPYKRIDERPRARRQWIGLVRWNHHLEPAAVTLRSSWRAYRDSFGIRSHTLTVEPVWNRGRWTIAPQLRLYTQSAAHFYYDPVYSFVGAPWPAGYFEAPPRFLSPDQRLAAFGAVTLGIKVAVQLGEHWGADLKLEHYEQRSGWRLGGSGSPGLERFSARFVQWGLVRRF